MHADGGGLHLQVTKTRAGELNNSWLFRYSVGGRERQMGLGSLTEVKLAGARRKAAECREQRLDGIEPIEARESARWLAAARGVTFRRAFELFFATKRKSLSNAKHPRSGSRRCRLTSSHSGWKRCSSPRRARIRLVRLTELRERGRDVKKGR
jgi:hypothetical protein